VAGLPQGGSLVLLNTSYTITADIEAPHHHSPILLDQKP